MTEFVMAGLVRLVPAIHAAGLVVSRAVVLLARGHALLVASKTWMTGTRLHEAGHDG